MDPQMYFGDLRGNSNSSKRHYSTSAYLLHPLPTHYATSRETSLIDKLFGDSKSTITGTVLVASACALAWFGWHYFNEKQYDEKTKLAQAETAKYLVEIDRLNRINESLLEKSDHAVELNKEVQSIVQALNQPNADHDQINADLQQRLQSLNEIVNCELVRLQNRNEELLVQNRNLREETLCKICVEYPVAASFVPCGHGSCSKCAPRLAHNCCPFCRSDVTQVIPRY